MGTHTCPWCGLESDGSKPSCSACGATIDARHVVTNSGWSELPGRKDMAKLQFGNSSCQIEGTYVPVADFNLAPEDHIYFAHHVLLWKEPQVAITTMSLKGAWKRLLSGMPLVMTQAQGPGHIAFSRDAPGEMIALPLQPGQAVDVREHLRGLKRGIGLVLAVEALVLRGAPVRAVVAPVVAVLGVGVLVAIGRNDLVLRGIGRCRHHAGQRAGRNQRRDGNT